MNANNAYLCIFFTVGSIFSLSAMDKPLSRKVSVANKMKEYVDVDTHPIIYHTGKQIRF